MSLSYEGDWSFSNPFVSDGDHLIFIYLKRYSYSPWSYVVYENKNCEGQFFSQYSSFNGLNFQNYVDYTIQSIHTSSEYHVKIMDVPSSIKIDGNYYIL